MAVACGGSAPSNGAADVPSVPSKAPEPPPSGSEGPSGPPSAPTEPAVPAGFVLHTSAHVRLDGAQGQEEPPEGQLTLWSMGDQGSQGPLKVTVEGPFEVIGDLSPLKPRSMRTLTVRLTADLASVAAHKSVVTLEVDQETVQIGLNALVSPPGLPAARWTRRLDGWQTIVSLPSAPFPDGSKPYKDASVLIFVPDGFTGQGPVNAVVHVHGYYGRLREVTERHLLREQLVFSGRDAILVAPQGPFDAADLSLGKLDRRGGLKQLMIEVASVLHRGGFSSSLEAGAVVLSGHSGGYRGVARMLSAGGVPIRGVLLFDALYGRPDPFFEWARRGRGRRLRSSWTWKSSTEAQNEFLTEALEASKSRVGSSLLDVDLRRDRISIGWQRFSHDEVMRKGQSFGRWVATSGLPAHPWAAPELYSAIAQGEEAVLTWRSAHVGRREAPAAIVEGSEDGVDWKVLRENATSPAKVPLMSWYRVREPSLEGGESFVSRRYGATGGQWLVVDGLDRGSSRRWEPPTHGFASALGQALGAPFSVASDEAIAEGKVRMTDYKRVLWIAGDQGDADAVLTPRERMMVRRYLKRGGAMIMTGSHLGRALGPGALATRFGARLVRVAPWQTAVEGWRLGQDGVPEPQPEELDGDDIVLRYGDGAAAAVGFDHKVIITGFGLEALDPQSQVKAMARLSDYLR